MNILTWFDILKNQVLSNTSLGSTMDWNNPEIEEEDDDCIRKLMGIYERAKNYTKKYFEIDIFMDETETNPKLSEKKVCKVLNTFKKADDETYYKEFNDFGFDYYIRKNAKFENLSKNTVIYIHDKISNFRFFVQVTYNLYEDTIQIKEKQREYIDICKKVFGEYYNSTYEEVFGDS